MHVQQVLNMKLLKSDQKSFFIGQYFKNALLVQLYSSA